MPALMIPVEKSRTLRIDRAAKHERIAAAKPDLAQAHNNLAIVCHHLNRYDEEDDVYQRALKLEPENAEV